MPVARGGAAHGLLGKPGRSYRRPPSNRMWTWIWQSRHHWPWATIAAFMAVGVAMGIANSQSRERRRLLRQEAIINIKSASNDWITAASAYLAYVSYYNARNGGAQTPWSVERLAAVSNATSRMDRALMAAHMTCTDFEILRQLTHIGTVLEGFLELISGPYPDDPNEIQQRLETLPGAGVDLLATFNTANEALLNRGLAKYGLRTGALFRVRRKLSEALRRANEFGRPPRVFPQTARLLATVDTLDRRAGWPALH